VFGLTAVVNHFTGGVRYISFQEQVIMDYGFRLYGLWRDGGYIIICYGFWCDYCYCLRNMIKVIMAYGGLRGAVSFSLAFMLPDTLQTKGTLLLATYVVILFTVFGQGLFLFFFLEFL
jgi:hypothetical protein